MGILADFLNRKKIDEQAQAFAELFMKRLPKEQAEKNAKLLSAELKILLGHALGYQRQSHLGIYGTARLADSIQWTLINGGYAPDFAKHIGKELSIAMAADRGKAVKT